jgi:hypothetical protein
MVKIHQREVIYPAKGKVFIEDVSGEPDWRDLWRDVEIDLDTIELPPNVISSDRYWSEGELDRLITYLQDEDLDLSHWMLGGVKFVKEHCMDGKHSCFFPSHRITHDLQCGDFYEPKAPYQVVSKWYTNPPKRGGKIVKIKKFGESETLDGAKRIARDVLEDPDRSTYDDFLTVEWVIRRRDCEVSETTLPTSRPGDVENHHVRGFELTVEDDA